MASQAFRSAPRSSWKSFSRWRGKRGSVMQGSTAAQRPAWTRTQLSIWLGLDYPIVRRHRSVRTLLHRWRPAEHADPRCDDAEIQELPGIGARDDQGTRETQRALGARARISGAKRCAFSARPVGPDACRSPHGVGGFCEARIISIAGPSPRKGTFCGTPDFLWLSRISWAKLSRSGQHTVS